MKLEQQLLEMSNLVHEIETVQKKIVKEVIRTGEKGVLTIKIAYERATESQIVMNPELIVKMPTLPHRNTMVNVSKDGEILDAAQMSFEDMGKSKEVVN